MTTMTATNDPARVSAALAYIPIIGWLYVYFTQRKSDLALFHLRQSIGLFVFLIGTFVAWVIVAWVLAWIPFMAILSAALFSLVIVAYLYGIVAWVMGIIRALRSQVTPLPIFGTRADRLPIQ
ncbi:MAG: hypothetical protein GC204_05885 [Chloroflexi bacterium]|nr:hypothetical protein [Chloroflexota bacterium]